MTKRETYYLYVVSCPALEDTPIKIGVTSDVPRRLSQMTTNSPLKFALEAVYAFDDRMSAGAAEKSAHRWFKKYQRHGEWFNVSLSDVDDFLKGMAASVRPVGLTPAQLHDVAVKARRSLANPVRARAFKPQPTKAQIWLERRAATQVAAD